jgi:NTE family protein
MNHGTPRIFEQGPLLKPLLASAAFPGVFTPVEIDSILYADGGILNNFPVEPLLGQCKQIIGVFCNPVPQIKSEQMNTSLQVLERAFHMGMAQTSLKKFELCDLVISPSKLSEFSTFSINHIQEVHDIGYEAAKENLKNSPFS